MSDLSRCPVCRGVLGMVSGSLLLLGGSFLNASDDVAVGTDQANQAAVTVQAEAPEQPETAEEGEAEKAEEVEKAVLATATLAEDAGTEEGQEKEEPEKAPAVEPVAAPQKQTATLPSEGKAPAPERREAPASEVKETGIQSGEEVEQEPEVPVNFTILGEAVEPGTRRKLAWRVAMNSINFDIPVIVAHGKKPGPTVCMTAAVHGDELNGIEIARQVVYDLNPETLAGTVVSVPIVNMEGFMKQNRYMADRRDLNRFFPGDPNGVTPARFAHGLFQGIIRHCDRLIDLHTGSYYRTNLPQLRADLKDEAVASMVSRFGALTVLHSDGDPGMLRNVATAAGIPSVTMEVGGPMSLEPEAVDFGVKAIRTFLGESGLTRKFSVWRTPQPVFYESEWVMSDHSGILLASVQLGDKVDKDEVIARIINPVTNAENDVMAPYSGTVLGMAVNQFVSPGYMIFRLGKAKKEEELREELIEQEKVVSPEAPSVDVIVDSEQEYESTDDYDQ